MISGSALATWSVVVVNRVTGEVCIASATCLSNFNLEAFLPVVVVGEGAGAAQSFIDSSGTNRLKIRDGLAEGWKPQRILDLLALTDSGHQTRQYGIVNRHHPPVTFSGTIAGVAKAGVAGQDGDLYYAIQGNVLTGEEVVFAAEDALLATPGDVGQRVMAAMEAARALGGDGRCSCAPSAPTSCGVPPPDFSHSAFTGFVIVARPGDQDGTCPFGGCASGDYYLNLNQIGSGFGLDPVLVLQQQYDAWRLSMAGVADQLLTEVRPESTRLVADGMTGTSVTVQLVDLDGAPVASGGQSLSIIPLGIAPVTGASAPVDNNDGTHTFEVFGTASTGTQRLRLVVQDSAHTVRLVPDLAIAVDPVAELHVGLETVSAATGGVATFTLNLGSAGAGANYRILGSAAGTSPGTDLFGVPLPLNRDRLLGFTWLLAGSASLPGTEGALDSAGRAEGRFLMPPALLAPFVGERFDFAAVRFGNPDAVTNVVGFDIVP